MLSICQTRTPKNRLAKIYSEALFYAIKFWIIICHVFAAQAPRIFLININSISHHSEVHPSKLGDKQKEQKDVKRTKPKIFNIR